MVTQKRCGRETKEGNIQQRSLKSISMVILAGFLMTGTISPKPLCAEEEWRVGGMLQIPFGGSKEESFVHFTNTRLGIKVQYAEIDDVVKTKEQTVERIYQDGELESSNITREAVVTVNEGDKVVGGEAYLMISHFSGFWNLSGGVNGFGGLNVVQGSAGLGYDPSFGVYMGIGGLLPYSQVGVRLNFRHIDYFVGATSLPKFAPKTIWEKESITYNDVFSEPPEEFSGEAGNLISSP